MVMRFSTVEKKDLQILKETRESHEILYRRRNWDLVGNNTPVFFKDAKKFVILFTLKKGILIPI
jgi:catalase